MTVAPVMLLGAMRLFDDRLRTAVDPALYIETTFEYLDRSARPVMDMQRELLETWFARYPSKHRAHLQGRLFSSRESEQRSAWWELYLHESFVRAGLDFDVSSGTPDFTLEGPRGRFHVEATARFEDPGTCTRERRQRALHDALDRACSGPWRIGIELLRTGATSAPASRFRARIEAWLASLDFEEIRRRGRRPNHNGFERFPCRVFEEGDWAISVEAWPLGLLDEEGRRRAVILWGPGDMVEVQNEEPLRATVARKASECRGLDAPLIIAVLVARNYGHEQQVESALFSAGSASPLDGRPAVAGVLAGVRLDHFSFRQARSDAVGEPRRATLGVAGGRWATLASPLDRRCWPTSGWSHSVAGGVLRSPSGLAGPRGSTWGGARCSAASAGSAARSGTCRTSTSRRRRPSTIDARSGCRGSR